MSNGKDGVKWLCQKGVVQQLRRRLTALAIPLTVAKRCKFTSVTDDAQFKAGLPQDAEFTHATALSDSQHFQHYEDIEEHCTVGYR